MPVNPGLTFLPGAVGQSRAKLILANVSMNQPLPTTFDDPLYVNPPWNPRIYWVIADGIPAIHGTTLPQAGASVLIAEDDYRLRHCIWWAGHYTAP
jgi:hypothetical protein